MNRITYIATIQTMGAADDAYASAYVAALEAALTARFPGSDVEVKRDDRSSASMVEADDGLIALEVHSVANEVWDRADF